MERHQAVRSRKSTFASLLVAMTCLPVAAEAVPITWHLSDVRYDDGGTASGSFTYDAALSLYSAISVTTTAGSVLPGASYFDQLPLWTSNASKAHFTVPDPDLGDFDPAVRFEFASAMTDEGGTIDLLVGPIFDVIRYSPEGWYYGVNNSSSPVGTLAWQRFAVSGFITSQPAAVPEPGTLALFGVGLGALTILRRRRRA
jgi:hypothetical protein